MKYFRYPILLIGTLVGALIGLGVVVGLSFLVGPTFIAWIDVTISLLIIAVFTYIGFKLTKKYTKGVENGVV